MSKQAIVFGTGSFAQVVRFLLERDSEYTVVAYTVSETAVTSETLDDLPVVPFEDVETRLSPDNHDMFIAIGYAQMNKVRERFCGEAKAKGYRLLTYLSSKASHWGDTVIGENVFIFEDNTIQPFVTIGDGTVLWSGNHIGHHSTIGPYCFITSHVVVSGHVDVGGHSFIGVNATIRDDIAVGNSNLIGAGAVILKTTQDGEVYATPRTKPIDRDSSHFFQ